MSGTQAVATWLGRELSGGRYRVDAQLGEGGMGTVFRAWDKNLSTEVVIKVPHAAMLQEAEFAARFAREISSLVKLSHPHIVKISDVGDHDRLPFAVMQFLPGGSLEDRQKSDPAADVKPLPPDSLKSWLVSIADALDFVHSQGYIHRDVKPANILFDAHGHAYLSDFGIAKSAEGGAAASSKTLTGSGMVIGTPEYMAPELIMGQNCDGRVDQYALAITVFEMLAGRRPFEDATSTALYVQHATAEPPDLTTLVSGASPAIAAAIHRALSKSPDQRFASCRAFATVLLGAVETFATSQPEAADSKCPVCQSSLKLADRMRGKQLRCAGCHSMLDVSDDLRLMPVVSSANETVARTTTRFASGTRAQAIISAVETDDSYRLRPNHVLKKDSSEPVREKTAASATRRAASLGEATLRSMSGKTIRPSMLSSSITKSPEIQDKPLTATQPLMHAAGKILRRLKCDFQAFAHRNPTLIAAVVWILVLVSIPPLIMRIFKAELGDSALDAELQRDPSATTSGSEPTEAKQPIPNPTSGMSQPVVAESELPAPMNSEENPDIKTIERESLDANPSQTVVEPMKSGLEQARAAYEAQLRNAKKTLLDRHTVLMNAASKAGNPTKAKTIQTWRDTFERDGWFAIPAAEIKGDILEYGRVTHAARQAFLSAYEDAIAARKKAGEMERASQLQNEKKELRLASRLVSLQCYRQSGVFIQHANLQGVTPRVCDDLNATLEMVPGLSDQSHVSFRSVNVPDHYLTHGDFQFVFRKLNAADPTFLRNSTFKRQSPLAQGAGNLAVSYEAVTHAGYFIRARNGSLRLERTNGSTQFRSEATFIVTEPQFPIWDD